MRNLPVFVLFLLIFPVQAHTQARKAQEGKNSDKPATTASLVDAQQTDSPELQTEKKKHVDADVRVIETPKKDGYDYALLTLNGILAIVGILGVGVGICTLFYLRTQAREMRRQNRNIVRQTTVLEKQTKAAEDAAKAARDGATVSLKQVNTLVDAERAWIVESIQFVDDIPYREIGGGVITARVTIQNIGKQPAFLKLVQLRFHSSEGVLPETPQYPATQVFPDGFMIAPNEKKYLRAALAEGSFDDETVNRIRGSSLGIPLKLYLYGCIVYMSMGKMGINQFCYKWNNQMGFSWEGAKPYFEKEGPSEYNNHT